VARALDHWDLLPAFDRAVADVGRER
jgi:hypothetical protein